MSVPTLTGTTDAGAREWVQTSPSAASSLGVLVRVRPRTVLLVATGIAVVLLGALVVFLAINGVDGVPG